MTISFDSRRIILPSPKRNILSHRDSRTFLHPPITDLSHEHHHSLRSCSTNKQQNEETEANHIPSPSNRILECAKVRKCCVFKKEVEKTRRFPEVVHAYPPGGKGCPRYTCTRVSIENKRAAPLRRTITITLPLRSKGISLSSISKQYDTRWQRKGEGEVS